MENPNGITKRAAIKLLGGMHFVGQTLADLSLKQEIKVRGAETEHSAVEVMRYRNERSYEYGVKLGLFPKAFDAIADMDQSQG